MSNLISTLSWPLTVVIILALIRKQLPLLAPWIKEIKYDKFVMSFSDTAQKGGKLSDIRLGNLPKIPFLQDESSGVGFDRIMVRKKMFESPKSGVIEAWSQVEQLVNRFLADKGVEHYNATRVEEVAERLSEHGLLDGEMVSLYKEMGIVMEQLPSVPGVAIKEDEAGKFVDSAYAIARSLNTNTDVPRAEEGGTP